MVLESILRSGFVLHHPIAMLFFGLVISTVSMGISLLTFTEYASILTIAFITMGTMPVLFGVFAHEEKAEAIHPKNPATFLGRHFHSIKVFSFLFLGIILAYAFWYGQLPLDSRELVFKEQQTKFGQISSLRGNVTQGEFFSNCQSNDILALGLTCIFANNALVLAWSLILSFFFGAGAVFLVAWNASVIGFVLGSAFANQGFWEGWARFVGLIPHGLPEVVSYFIGALAGGIISVAVAKKKFVEKEFQTVLVDVFFMIIIAFVLLLLAALIEAVLILGG